MSQPAAESASAVAAAPTPQPGSPAELLRARQERVDAAAAALIAAVRDYTEEVSDAAVLLTTAHQTWTDQQLAALGVLPTPALLTPSQLGPPDTIPLVTLADLGATLSRGADWAHQDIAVGLTDAGCPALPDGPGATEIFDIAAARLARGIADAIPDGLHLIGDTVWGPPGTDRATLADEAPSWRDHANVGEIVAQTGLWEPPSSQVMPTVRIEGRRDDLTPDGRIGRLATRAATQYWAVYGEMADGVLDLAADFGTEEAARRYAARWDRPGTLVYADHTEPLAHAAPTTRQASTWHTPRPATVTHLSRPATALGGRRS